MGGRDIRRADGVQRPSGGRVPLALLTLLLLVTLLPAAAVRSVWAQEEPVIVPALPEEAVAVVDGQPVVPEEPPVAVIEGEAVVPVAEPVVEVVEAVPAPAPLAPPPSIPLGNLNWAPPRTVYIPETGHSVDGVFLDVWRAWGGALSWGYPLTPEFMENGHIVQYYGYGRFEYWPEDPEGVVVHFGKLGAESRPVMVRRTVSADSAAASETAIAARSWLPRGEADVEADAGVRFVPETGHTVAGDFRAFWEATGEATYLGNPLSEPYVIAGNSYQVFERGKVIQEPGGSPYMLPIGALAVTRQGLDTTPIAQGNLPIYDEALFVPPPIPLGNGISVDPTAEKWVRISISQQYLWAMQGDVVLWEGYISTGRQGFDTPTGTYYVLSKLESQTMEGVLGGEYYNVPDVPDVMYFTDRGHAIHGTYWHNAFGTPMSHGCVNLPMDVADWMYQWAGVGMRVQIDA